MCKIIVAEDHEDLRWLLAKRIEELGHDVLPAVDGRQALEIFETNRDAIVVTDGQMPRLNGPELVEHIRRVSPKTVVILITGDVEIGKREARRKGGANVVMLKTPNISNEVAAYLRNLDVQFHIGECARC
jgi:two-component system sensor histidine kinase EvgS